MRTDIAHVFQSAGDGIHLLRDRLRSAMLAVARFELRGKPMRTYSGVELSRFRRLLHPMAERCIDCQRLEEHSRASPAPPSI